jgi:hypothetical protein
MLRDDEESFNLNQLWVVQGRLITHALFRTEVQADTV